MITEIKTVDLPSIKTSWRRGFSTNDPFIRPFQETIEVYRILYPTDGYHLTKEQYSALMFSLEHSAEACFFLSIVESEDLSFLERSWGHWSCSHASYEEYSEVPLTLENALYSMEGYWGALVSHEMHALIGGPATMMARFDEIYGDPERDLHFIREAWADTNATWLERIIDGQRNDRKSRR